MEQKNEISRWEKVLKEKVQPAFMAPWQEKTKEEEFKDIVRESLRNINSLKGDRGNKRCFLGEPKCSMKIKMILLK
ncbi:hypothetical protein [Clostridium tetanomorphum]|uniref:hypothetical protein n=1 Tax=Clostridium tetanomorphum TaxID=1553 RepID=UPI000D9794FF|nr:hypothetical protein [Clostridium tetanomorphum]SQB92741.1 L-2,4-diaminobutyrate decarboxylase [Clostridium tetanomorphum]